MKALILALLTLSYVYRVVLQIVQQQSAGNPTPANVADVYDGETYLRWKRYSAANSRLSLVNSILSYGLLLVLMLTDAHAAVAALLPEGMVWSWVGVMGLQILVETAVGVVISYVDTMVIEQKFGFNRSTMKTFVTDQLRGLVIELLLTAFLVSLLAVLHIRMGDWLILLFAAAVFGLSLVISFLYPVLSRIGNKFTPLEDGELKDRLMELLTKHGYKVKAIEVMDASRRTTKLNAYFTGFGKMKTIVLYDNLVNAMSTDEICAVFSHELGHGLHKDVPKRQLMNLGNLLLMAATVWLAVKFPQLHTAFGFEGVNYAFAYILLTAGLGLIQPLTGMVMNAYSRYAEFRADRQAVLEGYGPHLVTALKKLARENFAHLAPSPVLVALEYSHPPLSKRIEAIEKDLAE